MVQKEFEQIVGKELMLIRKDAGLSIEELARKTHIASSTISKYENAKNKMYIDVIYKLVSNCNSDMNIFFTKCIAKMQQ